MTVLGVGVYREGRYVPTRAGRYTREYQVWKDMLRRCYSLSVQVKQPAYVGCTVEPQLQDFQVFAGWANEQKGFHVEGYQLDKDLLVPGNREYRRDRLVFIPQGLNKFLVADRARRGQWPQGVYWDTSTGMFKSQLSDRGRRENLGRYPSAAQAAAVYAKAKTAAGRAWAVLLKEEGLVDQRVIECMQNYQFNVEG